MRTQIRQDIIDTLKTKNAKLEKMVQELTNLNKRTHAEVMRLKKAAKLRYCSCGEFLKSGEKHCGAIQCAMYEGRN